MQMRGHGGGCCGIRSLSGFSTHNDEDTLRQAKNYLRRSSKKNHISLPGMEFSEHESDGIKNGKIVEVVLTDNQIERLPLTCAYLKHYGFKLIHRFKNSTGSMCNVLHYCYSTRDKEESPWSRIEASNPTAPGDADHTPQVGEVWRIKNLRGHNLRMNCYVRVVNSEVDNRVVVAPIRAGNYRDGRPNEFSTQVVVLDQISFIRRSV